MDESHRERLERRLPHIYKNPQNWQREWESLLGQELGNHLDQIEESIRKFASLRPILLEFMSEYERDGTAERILAEYVEERLNGVPLHLLSKDFAPHSQLQHFEGAVTDEPGSEANDELDRIDRRSVTMAAESMSNPDAQQTMISMAPPPRPGAPMAPMTPVTPSTTFTSWRNSHIQAEAGPSRQAGVLSLPILSEVSETIENQKGKRTIDSLGPQGQQQSPTSPSKRPKTSSANIVPRVPLNITRTVDFFEVAENEYIFRDARCGPGWLVIRCYSGKTQFLEPTFRIFNHPLKNNLALGHFNQKMTCHPAPPKDKYTEEMILQNFAWRGECSCANVPSIFTVSS